MPAASPRVDRYELLGELATGGMATVYLGRQHGPFGFTRTVAIKSMHPQFAKDEGFRAMFLDEAQLTARIRHPNVVPTLDIVAAESNVLLVMEYVEGVSLSTLLRRAFNPDAKKRVSPALASAILCDTLHGLHAAHELKDDMGTALEVVHRDVSPQNIHVGSDGLGRVLDFGVAKAASRRYVTQSGEVKGKLAYMSREQICGEPVDLRTDIYAAGIVLWEMLAGRRLITAQNEGAIIKQVLDSTFEPPSFYSDEEISPELDKVVMKALAAEKEDRWASADEMATALAAAQAPAPRNVVAAFVRELGAAELESRAHRLRGNSSTRGTDSLPQEVSALAELLTEHATVTVGPTVREQKPERGRSRTPLLVAGGAVLVLALVGGAFVVGSKSGRPTDRPSVASSPPTTTPSDASSAVVLVPIPVVVSASASASAAPPPSSSSEPPKKPGVKPKPTPKKPDCRVPYVVDANGDRHYRPECVQ